jgi:GH24 family phage-related lysozyme (muramidase)
MTSGFNDFKNGDIIVTAGLDVPEKDENGNVIYYTYKSGKQKTNRHMRIGHIQIFYDGAWYCDRRYKSANVYAGDGDRPSFVFRGIDSDAIIPQSNNGNGFGLKVENGKVYWGNEYLYDEGWDWQPSESIKAKIKSFEGWHGGIEGRKKKPGWVKCPSGHWTTGWGFKETIRLRNDYPNGMTEEQANNYFEEVAVPERVKELKRVMKDMMFYKQHQMDALFDLLYNVGVGHFTTSKSPNMMSALSVRNLQNAARNMDHGLKSGLDGLVTRRKYDQNLFLNGNY